MNIQPLTLADISAASGLTPPDWPAITPYFDCYVSAPHCSPLKAVSNGAIIGIGSVIFHNTTAWLAHIIVHPDYQGSGVGRAITQALLDSVDRSRYPTVLLIATAQGEPLYERMGFRVDREYVGYRLDDPSLLPAVSGELRSYEPQWERAIIELDEWVSGEVRINTLRPHLAHARLLAGRGMLEGCYLPTLGEGLITASGEAAGTTLMLHRMMAQSNAVMPASNRAAVELVEGLGFRPARNPKRMFLGKPLEWRPHGLYNRIGGNLG